MLVYYFFILILFICVFAEERVSDTKGKNRILKYSLVPYFILMAFKGSGVGSDTKDYFASFALMSNCDFSNFLNFDEMGYERIEKGYKLLIWLLTRITPDGQILLLTTAIISTCALYYFIKENATNRSLALFFFITLGFFQFAMSGIRQTIAISITLFGYKYIKEHHLIKTVLITLFAMQFHKSAMFYAPMWFVAGMKLNKKNIIWFIIVIIGLYLCADFLFLTAADVMDLNYGIEGTDNGYIFFSIVLIITYFCLNNRRQLLSARPLNSIFINGNFVSMALWTLRLVSRTAERMTLYYMPFSYVVLEQYISTRRKNIKIAIMMVAMIASAFLCLRRLTRDEDFNTFHFFFN